MAMWPFACDEVGVRVRHGGHLRTPRWTFSRGEVGSCTRREGCWAQRGGRARWDLRTAKWNCAQRGGHSRAGRRAFAARLALASCELGNFVWRGGRLHTARRAFGHSKACNFSQRGRHVRNARWTFTCGEVGICVRPGERPRAARWSRARRNVSIDAQWGGHSVVQRASICVWRGRLACSEVGVGICVQRGGYFRTALGHLCTTRRAFAGRDAGIRISVAVIFVAAAGMIRQKLRLQLLLICLVDVHVKSYWVRAHR